MFVDSNCKLLLIEPSKAQFRHAGSNLFKNLKSIRKARSRETSENLIRRQRFFSWFVSWFKRVGKIKLSQKWALVIGKYAARLGDLGKRVFGLNFLMFEWTNVDVIFWVFRISGFLAVSRIFSHFLALSPIIQCCGPWILTSLTFLSHYITRRRNRWKGPLLADEEPEKRHY